MTEKPPRDEKKQRLASQLRANLARRKAQARARRAGEEDARPDGIAAAENSEGKSGKDEPVDGEGGAG